MTNPSETRDSELVAKLRDRIADNNDPREMLYLLAEAADTIDRLTSSGEALTWPPIIELGKTLAFYTSVIKSGESWSPECAAAYDRANKALQDLYADLGASPREGHVEVPPMTDISGIEAALAARPVFPGEPQKATVAEIMAVNRGTPNPQAYVRAAIQAYLPFHPPASREEGLNEDDWQALLSAVENLRGGNSQDEPTATDTRWRIASNLADIAERLRAALIPTKPEAGEPAIDLALIEATARKINPGRSEDHIKSVALDALTIFRALQSKKPE